MNSWEKFKLKNPAQVEVDQHEMPAFLETASELRVKGLSEQDVGMVSLLQPAARNLYQSSDQPEISVVGGVGPGHSKIKGRGRRAKTIGNLKKEVVEVNEVNDVDFNVRESGDDTTKAALRSGLLRPKQVDVEPKMSIVSRMSLIRNPKGKIRKVHNNEKIKIVCEKREGRTS